MAGKSRRSKKSDKAKVSTDQSGGSSEKQRLPFEPVATKKPKQLVKQATVAAAPSPSSTKSASVNQSSSKSSSTIPDVVSRRMVKRMALLCGLPTLLGLLTFPTSYLIVTQEWLDLPNVAVLLISLGLFGLGVLGLSYGVLSASWDVDQPGSRLGWQEFKLNFGRLRESWRNRNQQNSS